MWRKIAGRLYYVVQTHSQVLPGWAHCRKYKSKPLTLITFDNHTDTHDPLQGHIYWDVFRGEPPSNYLYHENRVLAEMLGHVSFENDSAISEIASLTRWDEHIHTAKFLKIIDDVHIVLTGGGYESDPDHTIIEAGKEDFLEDEFLSKYVFHGRDSFSEYVRNDYILDIDLDAFLYLESASPNNSMLAKRLLAGASMISIAIEESCVASNAKLYDKRLTPSRLARRLHRLAADLK